MVEKPRSTIIIVPHTHGKVYKLHVSPRTLKLLVVAVVGFGLLSLLSLAASGSFLRQRAIYRAMQRENKQLKKSNQRLNETLGQVQVRLNQFEQRTKTLAIAAGVSDLLNAPSDTLRSQIGSGGPATPLLGDAESLLRKQDSLDRQLAKVERRLSEQSIMLSHTPSVAPIVGVLMDGFGPRIDPFSHQASFHEGQDIAVAIGSVVRAPADGVVTFADRDAGYGRMLKIDHGYGFETVYGHLGSFLVKEGARVKRGQPIGKVGMSGRTTGPHLHYEVWKDGEKQNPLHYILDAY